MTKCVFWPGVSGWRLRRIVLGGPLHQAPIHVDVSVKSLPPVAIRKASGAMSSRLSSAGQVFRKSQAGTPAMPRTQIAPRHALRQ